MHLLQRPCLGIVPAGEMQCDIWTLARSELFLDEKPCYLELAAGMWQAGVAPTRPHCATPLSTDAGRAQARPALHPLAQEPAPRPF